MMQRGALFWIAVAAAGIVALLGIGALLGDDDSDEVVPAGEWAQSVCGAVGVWRGELEATVEDIRTPTSAGSGIEEPQSETPQGRTGFVRQGLERAVQATETMVEGVERAGTPDTPQGEDVAQLVSSWADAAVDELQGAQDSLDEEADSLEDAIEQITDAAGAIGRVLASGTRTIADAVRADPELAVALRNSSTCIELQEETG